MHQNLSKFVHQFFSIQIIQENVYRIEISKFLHVLAEEVKHHNPIIGSKRTTLSQCDDYLFGTKTHVLHNRIMLSLPQRIALNIQIYTAMRGSG